MGDPILRGGCMCGAVTYEVRPPVLRFAECHCSRCRRATGSAHATNLYVAPDRFGWTSGEKSCVRYDLPSARSFATTFCRSCGAPLPHHTRSGREIVIPAGSLDDDPGLRPEARIYWGSRAAWSCGQGDTPVFAEYPDDWTR